MRFAISILTTLLVVGIVWVVSGGYDYDDPISPHII